MILKSGKMGSFVFIGLLVLAGSVYYANSQRQRFPIRTDPYGQRPPIQTNPHVYGVGNTQQGRGGGAGGGGDTNPCQQCETYCISQGCDPPPSCNPRSRVGCRCMNCYYDSDSHDSRDSSDVRDWY